MTIANTICYIKKIDESSSNRITNLNSFVIDSSSYQNCGRENIDCDMSTINGQQLPEKVQRFSIQENERIIDSCQSIGLREMNANLNKIDNVINGLQSFGESESSYNNIADLQELLRDKGIHQPVVNEYHLSFEERNSSNGEPYNQESSESLINHKHSATRNRPYSKNFTDWSSPKSSMRNPFNTMNITCNQQNVDRSFSNSKSAETNPPENGEYLNFYSDWSSENNKEIIINETTNTVNDAINKPIPSIVVNDHGENSVSTGCEEGRSQSLPDSNGTTAYLPTTRTSMCSPFSCYNVAAFGPNSSCSSRAQSPGFEQLESQLMPYNVISSPVGSPQITSPYMIMQGQSSPSSSTRSYSDTPSPVNYQTSLHQQIEDQLKNDLGHFSIWDNNNELQLVHEVLQDLQSTSDGNEDVQIVPNFSHSFTESSEDMSTHFKNVKDDYQRMMSAPMQTFNDISSERNTHIRFSPISNEQNMIDVHKDSRTWMSNSYNCDNAANVGHPMIYGDHDELRPKLEFSHFRSPERDAMVWPSLYLPSIEASERLKEGLNPKDVEKAMISLLKKSVEELAMRDEDGDTELMRLVGNPEELARKKAYLVPLVERLSNVRDALSMTNNRDEDALYLAAINCPEMPHVAGYLAATMLEKGIDINQKLYHSRGDSLIHSVAARGDSHSKILVELLALKTTQGNAVFDLSKKNYDGKTALHVAVESHDPTGRGSRAMVTVCLLLHNGADPNVKEPKSGNTALHMAALSCDSSLIKVLLGKVGSGMVNATNYNCNTPLHIAAAASNMLPVETQKEVCWVLTQAGGQSNFRNQQGKTPLALVSSERKDLIRQIFRRD